MSRKLFAVSDVHGHFTALSEALDRAGFDSANEDHIFVSCGDLFDRGTENVKVYEFVRSLERKILIRGNHEDMLRDALKCGRMDADGMTNGTDKTVKEFFGRNAIDGKWNINVTDRERLSQLVDFLDSTIDFHEEGKYIFTHGWLPDVFEGRLPTVDPLWRETSEAKWKRAHWSEWQQYYGAGVLLDGRIIVCGHRPARLAHNYDASRTSDNDAPFFGRGMIAIDTYTVRSGRIEVLVIDGAD